MKTFMAGLLLAQDQKARKIIYLSETWSIYTELQDSQHGLQAIFVGTKTF